jgi:hypothetical protein
MLRFFRFYFSLLRAIPSHSWNKGEKVGSAIGVVVGFFGFIQPELARALTVAALKLSRWWAIVPLVVVVVYATLKILYDDSVVRDKGIAALKKQIEDVPAPDVMLEWDWQNRTMSSTESDRDIFVMNRSEHAVYNAQIQALELASRMEFDCIFKAISPEARALVTARWNQLSSFDSAAFYDKFFCNGENEESSRRIGYSRIKPHNRGLSAEEVRVPLTMAFTCRNMGWVLRVIFVYDVGGATRFERVGVEALTPLVSETPSFMHQSASF